MIDNEILARRRKRLTPRQPTPTETFGKVVADIRDAIAVLAAIGLVIWAILA